MAHQRTQSEVAKTPHSVSLKVLRLSRPSLSLQHPLPKQAPGSAYPIDPRAALSSWQRQDDDQFILDPLLTLPPTFGTVNVGEAFACTLCANNELPAGEDVGLSVNGVRMTAEMQTPSQTENPISLDLTSPSDETNEKGSLDPGDSMQRVVRFDLREEGNHVLAVTVSYTETHTPRDAPSGASSGRARTFRKLYQFSAQQLLSVRTKSRPLPFDSGYVLEAQLENRGDQAVVLDAVSVNAKEPFTAESLNAWDLPGAAGEAAKKPTLHPRNILQVAFRILEPKGASKHTREASLTRDGRVLLGQMSIQWRGAMGEPGALNTGWLSIRRT